MTARSSWQKGVPVFRGVINDAKSAAGALIAKYTARASVAVPFVIALGFATAAVTVLLVDRLGAIAAYSAIAVAFTIVGLLAIFTVQANEHHHEVVDKAAAIEEQANVTSVAASEGAAQVPLALMATLMSAVGGPTSTLAIARLVGRNLPIIALAAVIGVLLIEEKRPSATDDDAILDTPKLNGSGLPATGSARVTP